MLSYFLVFSVFAPEKDPYRNTSDARSAQAQEIAVLTESERSMSIEYNRFKAIIAKVEASEFKVLQLTDNLSSENTHTQQALLDAVDEQEELKKSQEYQSYKMHDAKYSEISEQLCMLQSKQKREQKIMDLEVKLESIESELNDKLYTDLRSNIHRLTLKRNEAEDVARMDLLMKDAQGIQLNARLQIFDSQSALDQIYASAEYNHMHKLQDERYLVQNELNRLRWAK